MQFRWHIITLAVFLFAVSCSKEKQTMSNGLQIEDIKIGGQGCSISQASASMMTEIVKGKSVTEAEEIIHAFKEMMDIYESELSGKEAENSTSAIDLGDLEALQGVVKYPVRIKCATLAWNTLTQSIDEIQGFDN